MNEKEAKQYYEGIEEACIKEKDLEKEKKK